VLVPFRPSAEEYNKLPVTGVIQQVRGLVREMAADAVAIGYDEFAGEFIL
jgi:hypothetical protein